jgi:Skp family chaperone for outer membrane proteins
MKPAAIAFLALSLAACSSPPVGYFDPQRVVAESAEAKALMAAVDTSPAVVKAREAAQRAEQAAKTSPELAAPARAEEALKAFRDVYQKERAAAGAKLDDRIAEIVTPLAAKRGLTVVFPIAGKLPYADHRADLTIDIITALDGGGELVSARQAARAAAEKVQKLEAAAQAPADTRHVTASRGSP